MRHPSLEGSGTPWVCAQESHQHPVLLDTKHNNMTVAVMNLYGGVTQNEYELQPHIEIKGDLKFKKSAF